MGRTTRMNKRMKKAQAAMMNPMMNPMMAMNPFMNPMMAAAMGGAPMGSNNVDSSSDSDEPRERERRGRSDLPLAAPAKASQPLPVESTASSSSQQQQQMVAATDTEPAPEQAVVADVFTQAVSRAMRGLDQHRADLYNADRENMTITRRTAWIRGLPKARLLKSRITYTSSFFIELPECLALVPTRSDKC